jgi:hypothetical protein
VDFLAGEAIDVGVGQRAALQEGVAEWIIAVVGHHRLAAVNQGGYVPIAIRMVIRMTGPGATGIPAGTGQKPTDAAGPFEAAAQVKAAGVADLRHIIRVPLLDDAHAVVKVEDAVFKRPLRRLLLQRARLGLRTRTAPTRRTQNVKFQPLAQTPNAVVVKVGAIGAVGQVAGIRGVPEPLDEPVFVVIDVSVMAVVAGGQVAVAVIAVSGGEGVGEFVLVIDDERAERAVVGQVFEVPGRVVRVAAVFGRGRTSRDGELPSGAVIVEIVGDSVAVGVR